jgi:DEAD/DEAH box helicase domain-containing protein
VPYTKNGVDERVVQSFMAALQLGLKRRFGGKVDHLRMVQQDEPGKNGGPRKHYVMLYDSVPGGRATSTNCWPTTQAPWPTC